MTVKHNASADELLIREISTYFDDPLGYIMFNFPWTTDPAIQMVPLKEPYASRYKSEFGPDLWFCEFLEELGEEIKKNNFNGRDSVSPVRFSTASGHGIGKSAGVAMLIKFILDTRPFSKGVVTANTSDQLRTKTWAELAKWNSISLTSHFWHYTSGRGSMSIYRKGSKKVQAGWRCDAMTCKEENAEAFQGLHAANSTPFYIFDEACHDDQTEVLTNEGWKFFKDVRRDDLLITPEGWQPVRHIHSSVYRGDMLTQEKRGLSLSVTPSHDMWGDSLKGVRKKVKAEDVTTLLAPRTVEWSNGEFPISDDEVLLDAWYFSEGHTFPGGFGITNNEDRGISALLTRMGFTWSKSNNQWLVYDKVRSSLYEKQGHGCLNKTIFHHMFNYSQRQMRLFLDTYVEGDGYIRTPARSIIYTSSDRMASDLHALAVLAGYNSSLTKRPIEGQRKWIKDHWAVSSKDGWVISLSSTGARVKLQGMKPVPYNGMVWCATVDAGVLLTRRNGTVIWSGNSGIPAPIWEARYGGATDGEPMSFDFGNPTRKSGHFFENTVGRFRHRHITRSVDSRTVAITNKALMEEWREDWGEDSDLFKVKVKGEFPAAGSVQFISSDDVETAMGRPGIHQKEDPLVIGVDVARFGEDSTVIYPRIGSDAKSFPYKEYKGLDTMAVVEKVIETIKQFSTIGKKCSGLFIDEGYNPGVIDVLARLGYNPIAVSFGRAAPNQKYRYVVDQMWGTMKEEIKTRLALPSKDEKIEKQLTQREYGFTNVGKIALESKKDMKERGLDSPDVIDALALTYFSPVAVEGDDISLMLQDLKCKTEFDPLEMGDNNGWRW